MKAYLLILYLAASAGYDSLPIAIEGLVIQSGGQPIAGAQILTKESDYSTVTDSAGSFLLSVDSLPIVLIIAHPRFSAANVIVDNETPLPLKIELTPTSLINEEITVTAQLSNRDFAPVGAAASSIGLLGDLGSPASVADVVEAVPGVALNGQGGLFQTYSVRGVSRHRIQNSVGGVRLAGERRAGVSTSFLDPFLIGSVNLLRGPSASYHGSGALGGVVDILPRQFEGWALETKYESQGDQKLLAGGWGNDRWSAAFARREAGNSEAADGSPLNSHFTQFSGSIIRNWGQPGDAFSVMVIPTLGKDIGKANSDYPERITNYPEEKHLLIRLDAELNKQWNVGFFLHPHDLRTHTFEDGGQTEVEAQSTDFGFEVNRSFGLSSQAFADVGIDYFGRRAVNSTESTMLADESPKKSLDDGAEDELGLKASLYFQTALAMLEVGGRFTSIRQLNANLAKVTGSAWNGFTGISVPLFKELELRAALGTGLRFPSLSERFFAGTTGRGQVIGNPNLVPERSLDTEIGLRWSGQKLFSSIHLFQNSISEYIERIESQLDVLTFVNLTNGTIRGLEWEGILAPSERWNLYARTHLIRGETEEGDALSDIPVDRITIGLRRSQSKWKMGSEFQFRKGKTFPGSAERVTEGAQLVSAYLACQLTAQLRASLSGENLLDQAFHETADRKSSLTTGRSFSIGLYWTPE